MYVKMKNSQVFTINLGEMQKITFEGIGAFNEKLFKTNDLKILGNYPNPFTEKTDIIFELNTISQVKINIYNSSGKQIQSLSYSDCKLGENVIQWDCKDQNNEKVAVGIYFYEIQTKNEFQSKKMILVK
ncbi:MAG: hypothetical protein A2X64_02500 [Ignavibacteria bacterium GWF2_33_9]|nr:MAG: hypothetical protein A2X64_02500 [Ignavibacteria bacterium GWF2_33_9]